MGVVGTNKYILQGAMGVVGYESTDCLARSLADTPDKQAAALVAVEALWQRKNYLKRVLSTGLSLKARRRAHRGVQWAYESILELREAAEAHYCFQEGCPDDRLTLIHHQQT